MSTFVHSEVLVKEQNINLKSALKAIAKEMQVKLYEDIDENTENQLITQTLSGKGLVLLRNYQMFMTLIGIYMVEL